MPTGTTVLVVVVVVVVVSVVMVHVFAVTVPVCTTFSVIVVKWICVKVTTVVAVAVTVAVFVRVVVVVLQLGITEDSASCVSASNVPDSGITATRYPPGPSGTAANINGPRNAFLKVTVARIPVSVKLLTKGLSGSEIANNPTVTVPVNLSSTLIAPVNVLPAHDGVDMPLTVGFPPTALLEALLVFVELLLVFAATAEAMRG